MNAEELVARLDLQPHPEGGWYKELYRSPQTASTPHGERNWCTGIYYLLDAPHVSRFHRLKQSDEMWHFYAGSELHVHMIHPSGEAECMALGSGEGAVYSGVVPAGTWFGAELAEPDTWALVGCTVSPGFDFADFEIADREELLVAFPDCSDVVRRLTP